MAINYTVIFLDRQHFGNEQNIFQGSHSVFVDGICLDSSRCCQTKLFGLKMCQSLGTAACGTLPSAVTPRPFISQV
jgi:hypothetical protein